MGNAVHTGEPAQRPAAHPEHDAVAGEIRGSTDGGRPAALYRRLGFVDEVYWYQKYELAASH